MKLSIVNPRGVVFEGDAEYIVVEGNNGQLAILENHIPIVVPIKEGFVKRVFENKEYYYTLVSGLLEQSNNIVSVIAQEIGKGETLEDAKNVGVENVEFLGALSGKDLIREFEMADLYLFPTCHAEGMPTSVLEAMAFGLPVVTRPVGGLCDFFENGKMGEMVDSFEAVDFVPMVEKYLADKELTRQTSVYNHEYAKKHFLASQVALDIQNKIKKYL